MTGEQRAILDCLSGPGGHLTTLRRGDQEAIAAALADLDLVTDDLRVALLVNSRICADLDACRAALRPIADRLRRQKYTFADQDEALSLLIGLGRSEADAVLAAGGEKEANDAADDFALGAE